MNHTANGSAMGSVNRVALAVLLLLLTCSTAFADFELSIRDGRVSIVARDATVRQILAQWEKIGQTTIVNLDKISGGPVTIELKDVSEKQALEILLRSVSGYIAAPRDHRREPVTFRPNHGPPDERRAAAQSHHADRVSIAGVSGPDLVFRAAATGRPHRAGW